MDNNRIGWIDIAKCLGIIFIVLGHVLTKGELRKIVYFFNVPLFFFLSGLTFKRKENKKEFIIQKIKSLYIPYIIISLISIFIYLLMGKIINQNIGFNVKDIFENFFGMIYANSALENMMWNRPLWFIPTFIVVVILTNFIENINNKKVKNIIVIIITSIGMILSYFKIYLPFQIETAFSMIIWTYLGINLKNIIFNVKKKKILLIEAIILTIIGIILGNINGELNIRVDDYGKNIFLYYISTFSLVISICFISKLIEKNAYMEYVGQSTLNILLLHKFPILFFQKLCPYIKDYLVSDNIILLNISAILISMITIIMCLLAQRILTYFFKYISKKINIENEEGENI